MVEAEVVFFEDKVEESDGCYSGEREEAVVLSEDLDPFFLGDGGIHCIDVHCH